jgi:hypothetical protein
VDDLLDSVWIQTFKPNPSFISETKMLSTSGCPTLDAFLEKKKRLRKRQI